MIFAVTDRKNSNHQFVEQIGLIASGKPDMIIFREKDLPERDYRDLVSQCLSACSENKVPACVNRYTETAIELGIDNIQLQMDILRKTSFKTPELNIGASVHSIEEAEEAEDLGAMRLIFGNVFETACKPGKAAAGTEILKSVCDATALPVMAIGGITSENVRAVMDAGAAGVCVMSSMMLSDDPGTIIRALRSEI